MNHQQIFTAVRTPHGSVGIADGLRVNALIQHGADLIDRCAEQHRKDRHNHDLQDIAIRLPVLMLISAALCVLHFAEAEIQHDKEEKRVPPLAP